jgi:hypothetical protein
MIISGIGRSEEKNMGRRKCHTAEQSEGTAIVEARLTVIPKVRNARKRGAHLTFAA